MRVFKSSSGKEIKVLGVSQTLIDGVLASVKFPEKPKYKAVTAGGGEEWYEHDLTTLETPEDKAAWAKYEEDTKTANAELYKRMFNMFVLKGTAFEIPNESDWVEEQQFLGIALPTNKFELKVHYLQSEILHTQGDYSDLTIAIMAESGAKEEVVASAQAAFRDQVNKD